MIDMPVIESLVSTLSKAYYVPNSAPPQSSVEQNRLTIKIGEVTYVLTVGLAQGISFPQGVFSSALGILDDLYRFRIGLSKENWKPEQLESKLKELDVLLPLVTQSQLRILVALTDVPLVKSMTLASEKVSEYAAPYQKSLYQATISASGERRISLAWRDMTFDVTNDNVRKVLDPLVIIKDQIHEQTAHHSFMRVFFRATREYLEVSIRTEGISYIFRLLIVSATQE